MVVFFSSSNSKASPGMLGENIKAIVKGELVHTQWGGGGGGGGLFFFFFFIFHPFSNRVMS